MFEEIFEGSPRERFFDVLFAANRSVVEAELERVFGELASYRASSENGNSNLNSSNLNDLASRDEALNDLYIEVTGEILSQNE